MFILVQCINMDITVDFHPYHYNAWTAMLNRMKALSPKNMKNYDETKDSEGYVDIDRTSCKYEIHENDAWMNDDGTMCNWKIVKVPER